MDSFSYLPFQIFNFTGNGMEPWERITEPMEDI